MKAVECYFNSFNYQLIVCDDNDVYNLVRPISIGW